MMRLFDSEAMLAKLGKRTIGKGCLYIKKLADVDPKVLEALVVKSVTALREHCGSGSQRRSAPPALE